VPQSVIIGFFGRRRDRFSEQGEALSLSAKFDLAARVPHIKGVEVIFPDEADDAQTIVAESKRTGLQIAAINVNLKGRVEFQRGALSSHDLKIRSNALKLLKAAKDLANSIGCQRITCAPLADGSDYYLQMDYAQAWSNTIEMLGAAAEYHPEIALHIEHKPSGPRVRGLLSKPDNIRQLAAECGVGITFNFGHALVSGGAPAEPWHRYHAEGIPLYVHLCDSSTTWDWDLLSGAHHWWSFVEFLQALRDTKYEGWIAADTFPIHFDALTLLSANAESTAYWSEWQRPGRFPWSAE
jgi:sugar phosphate isomerase/epimerase